MGKADLHLHTTYSDGQSTVRALLDAVATRTDLDVIAITDHDTIAGARVARRLALDEGYPFEVVIGEEVTTRAGHLVGLFLRRAVPPGLSAAAAIDAIHAQGGLVFAPHPFFRDRPRRARRAMDGIGALLNRLLVDSIEIDNGTPLLEWANWRARRFNRWRRLPALGSSDAHIVQAIGKSYTRFPGWSAIDLYHALAAGTIVPGAERYTPRELLAYFRFWCGYGRAPRVPAPVVADPYREDWLVDADGDAVADLVAVDARHA